MRVLDFAVRILIAAALGWAGSVKALDPATFYRDIVNFRIVPEVPAALLAVYLPWFEIAIAASLFVPALVRGAALCAAGLFAVFFVAVASALIRGLDIECGCFGGAIQTGSLAVTLAIDALLLAAAVWVLFRSTRPQAV